MMRALIVVAGAALVAGCAGSKERVTLLNPALSANSFNSTMGSLVIDPDGVAIPVEMADQQAHMCGDNCEPRIRELGKRDPRFTEIMNYLPREEMRFSLIFGEKRATLSKEQVDYVVAMRTRDLEMGERPGSQVLVLGYTDSEGQPADNMRLSGTRADNVAKQLREVGFEVEQANVVAMGERTARDAAIAAGGNDGDEDPTFRKVDIIIR
jgi:outer membrane protein OmpA-like peptidoglycan-associated protein